MRWDIRDVNELNNMYADCANGGNLPIIKYICPKQGKTNQGNKSGKLN